MYCWKKTNKLLAKRISSKLYCQVLEDSITHKLRRYITHSTVLLRAERQCQRQYYKS